MLRANKKKSSWIEAGVEIAKWCLFAFCIGGFFIAGGEFVKYFWSEKPQVLIVKHQHEYSEGFLKGQTLIMDMLVNQINSNKKGERKDNGKK